MEEGVNWAVWIGIFVSGLLASRSNSLFDLIFGSATVATAAGVSLFVLWQFRSRLVNSLAQARAAEENLGYEATHDSLTGLANRTLLSEKLSGVPDRGDDHGVKPAKPYALIFLELDRFKHVNDSLGHDMGDELLKVAAHRLRSRIREPDIIARMGGDEFVILLKDARLKEVEALAGRIQESFVSPIKLLGHELYVTASMGIVGCLREYRNPQGPIRDADTAMYRAKEGGRARFVVFDEGMRRSAVSLLKLENDLRRAVDHGEFVVHYQPVVWMANGGISGFEALVRWEHPERGLLYPDAFMELAEETGLIHDIDRFVMREACRQTAIWRSYYRDPFPPTVSVNLSSTGLSRPDLTGEVAEVLNETGLPGYSIVIEITESAVMEDAEAAMKTLHRLRRLGVRIHVDDFGTGYSSLQLLHRLPADALK